MYILLSYFRGNDEMIRLAFSQPFWLFVHETAVLQTRFVALSLEDVIMTKLLEINRQERCLEANLN